MSSGVGSQYVGPHVGNSIVQTAQGMPPLVDPATIKPVTGSVSDDELVQNQLNKIIGANSPLMQRAKALAMGNAAARGVQNSSLAAGAAQAAVMDAAMPIATSDAATFNRQALTNQDVTNQFLSQDKGLSGQRILAGEERAFQAGENSKNRDLQVSLAQAQMAASAQEAGARLQLGYAELQARGQEFQAQLAQQLRLAGIEDSRIRELTSLELDSRNASNLAGLQTATLNNYTNTLTSIYQSQMEPDARANALRNISSIYRGNPYLPITINLDAFPPGGTGTTGGSSGGGEG